MPIEPGPSKTAPPKSEAPKLTQQEKDDAFKEKFLKAFDLVMAKKNGDISKEDYEKMVAALRKNK